MNFLIERYITNLTIEDLALHAHKQGINLSEAELIFSFDFIKNNYQEVIKNPDNFDFQNYAGYYSEENFEKINNLINKYRHFL